LAADGSIVHAEGNPDVMSLQLSEPGDGATANSVRVVSRLQCLELLAASFFGIVSRSRRCPRNL